MGGGQQSAAHSSARAPSAPRARRRDDLAPLDAALPELELAPDTDDDRRIARILEKARFEAVMKDSISFLFKAMGAGSSELAAAVIAAAAGDARSAGSATPAQPDGDASPAPPTPPEVE